MAGVGPRRAGAAGALAAFVPVAAVAALPVLLALLKQGPCLDRGYGGTEPFWRFCYSDLAVGAQAANAQGGLTAYLRGEVPLDQPPLTGAVVSLIAGLAPGHDVLTMQRWLIGSWAILAVLGLLAMAWWVRPSRPGGPGNPWQVVLAPVATLTVLLSPDLLGVVLATGGLWAWGRRNPLLAGVLLGAGLMARTYPGVLLLVVALLAWRTGRERELARVALGAAAAVAVVAGPLLAGGSTSLTGAWTNWRDAGAGLGSVWYLPVLAGRPWSVSLLTLLSVLGIALAVVLAAVLALGAPRAPRPAAVALVAVAVILVTGKSFPVQASLWLVPLVAWAGLRWRDHLVWAVTEGIHFVMVWLYLGGLQDTERSVPPSWYALALLLRTAGVLFLAVRAWQTAGRPEPKRAPGVAVSAPEAPTAVVPAAI